MQAIRLLWKNIDATGVTQLAKLQARYQTFWRVPQERLGDMLFSMCRGDVSPIDITVSCICTEFTILFFLFLLFLLTILATPYLWLDFFVFVKSIISNPFLC